MNASLHIMCTSYVHLVPVQAFRGQKMALDLLKLDLQMVVSCHMGCRNSIWIICKSSKCS